MTLRFCILLVCSILTLIAQPAKWKALVGGTLIDGYGGAPIRNSVILIEDHAARANRAR